MVTGSEMDNTTNVTMTPVMAPDEPNMSWDDATWIMTASFIIFTMQSGEWSAVRCDCSPVSGPVSGSDCSPVSGPPSGGDCSPVSGSASGATAVR